MEILSVIPARGGSKGIPLKNLILVNGKPLIYYTIMASLKSKVDRTIVSTDHKGITKTAKRYGAEVIFRPKKLSTDGVQIEPTIEHILNHLETKEKYIPDTIVLLQNTSPLRTFEYINKGLRIFQQGNYDSVVSAYVSHGLFLWTKKNKIFKPISYNPQKRLNRQQIKNQFLENGAIYITKTKLFKKSKCRMSGKMGILEMPPELSVQIDSNSDILFAEQILKKAKKNVKK